MLAAHDPLELVDKVFDKFSRDEADFFFQLDEKMVEYWCANPEPVCFMANAWLNCWDRHALSFADKCLGDADKLIQVLQAGVSLQSALLSKQIFSAASRCLGIFFYRDKQRFQKLVSKELVIFLVDCLRTESGPAAARILVKVAKSGNVSTAMQKIRPKVKMLLAELSPETLWELSFWISISGLANLSKSKKQIQKDSSADSDQIKAIEQCDDFQKLQNVCMVGNQDEVEAAVLRLLEFGQTGALILKDLLVPNCKAAQMKILVSSISAWPEGQALKEIKDFVLKQGGDRRLRFHLGLALMQRGKKGLAGRVLAVVKEGASGEWFTNADWQSLLTVGLTEKQIARELVFSPQYVAGHRSLDWLLKQGDDQESLEVLESFLKFKGERPQEWRLQAALHLAEHKRRLGEPLIFACLLRADQETLEADLKEALASFKLNEESAEIFTRSAVRAGKPQGEEEALLELFKQSSLPQDLQQRCYQILMEQSRNPKVVSAAVQRLLRSRAQQGKINTLAKTCAWGVNMARMLTEKALQVRITRQGELAYTRIEDRAVYISPFPILQEVKYGREIVEGLILHEIGHHLYHGKSEDREVWEEALRQGILQLLNLVADEHLERNLRAMDKSYGDRLKKTAAYSFQHSEKAVELQFLLQSLGERAFEVLSQVRLKPGPSLGLLFVPSGRILLEMERAGTSLARFVRGLRMGRGNRYKDPKVAQGLSLFTKKFKSSSMPELLETAKELQKIFADEVSLLDKMNQEAMLHPEAIEEQRSQQGLTDQELQDRVQKELRSKAEMSDQDLTDGEENELPVRMINKGKELDFEQITRVLKLDCSQVKYERYAKEVQHSSRKLKKYLVNLGLRPSKQKYRVQGKSFDRGRLRAMALHGDPRILQARVMKPANDLFFGVLVDCSSSMITSNRDISNIELAKTFGVMLAEAGRQIHGLDLSFWGFTDQVLFEAGTDKKCAVPELEAGGGNNDAAALWHVAQQAVRSKRKSKLLLMISDGSPTECSVDSLRALVKRLTMRMGLCCVQVAVRALDPVEVCFDNYIVLHNRDIGGSVREFGGIVARSVKRAL